MHAHVLSSSFTTAIHQGTTHFVNHLFIQKHRVPVQGIPCLEKWLFCKERNQLAEKWHQQAGDRKGLLIKLGMVSLKLCTVTLVI